MQKRQSKQSIGHLGEDIATKFIVHKGFYVLERNYRRKWGEIDIIARHGRTVHFFEVKSQTVADLHHIQAYVRPEENVHRAKARRIKRTAMLYFETLKIEMHDDVSFDVLCVYIDMERRCARVKWIENVIL